LIGILEDLQNKGSQNFHFEVWKEELNLPWLLWRQRVNCKRVKNVLLLRIKMNSHFFFKKKKWFDFINEQKRNKEKKKKKKITGPRDWKDSFCM